MSFGTSPRRVLCTGTFQVRGEEKCRRSPLFAKTVERRLSMGMGVASLLQRAASTRGGGQVVSEKRLRALLVHVE